MRRALGQRVTRLQRLIRVRRTRRSVCPAVSAWSSGSPLLSRVTGKVFESFRQKITGQLDGMRGQLNGLQGQIDGLRGELRRVKWILGGMFALMVPTLGGIIGIALQLGQR